MLIVNPLTAVAFFEIAKRNKDVAIVSNAAVGALGQMVLRLGRWNRVPVIHIVRRDAQVGMLHSMGGEYILNSSDMDFYNKLHQLSHQLKATLILDQVGGEQSRKLLDAVPSGSPILVYGSLSSVKNDTTSQASDPTKLLITTAMIPIIARNSMPTRT